MARLADDPTTPPQRTLGPCPQCGVLVCLRLWMPGAKGRDAAWEVLSPPRTPMQWQAHQCAATAALSEVATS